MGAEPEKVLVLELAGTVDRFISAVRRIAGLEWLAEFDIDDLPPTSDFHRVGDDELEKSVRGQLFLVMSNRTAVDQLLSMWQRYSTDDAYQFPYGQTSMRDLFLQLVSIRTWNAQDRLRETGLAEVWQTRVELGATSVRAEIELWYRSSPEGRATASEQIRRIAETEGGEILREVDIEEVAYHALIAQLPAAAVSSVISDQESQLVLCDDVMFMRPLGQALAEPFTDQESEGYAKTLPKRPELDPVVGLLDGLPLANHPLLRRHLRIDDPDNWEADYPALERAHGTYMASLILHGDLLDGSESSSHELYCRPIMKPDVSAFAAPRPEHIPEDQTFADILIRAVRRMFEGDGDEEPTAPTVRIINLSVCDRARPLLLGPSSIARVVDWLSLRYGVLFVISAGNHDFDRELVETRAELAALDAATLQQSVVRGIEASAHLHRVLAPAESLNAITVGGAHLDRSAPTLTKDQLDPYEEPSLPAVYNSVGPGFRRAVKPEILMPGGRQLVDVLPGSEGDSAHLEGVKGNRPPGLRVAAPGLPPARPTTLIRGTSGAAALATRLAEASMDIVDERLRSEGRAEPTRGEYAALLKAMLIHGARWGDAGTVLKSSLVQAAGQDTRPTITRYAGYGLLEPSRVLTASDQRVNLIAWGSVRDGEAHLFHVPIPAILSGIAEWRRLTITLACISPINLKHVKYRQAAVWAESNFGALAVERTNANLALVTRGTAQHEVLEGRRATPIGDDDLLEVKVNCRSDAGTLSGDVPYGLMLTLEVAPESGVTLFEEIRTKLRTQVAIRP
jgi:hypothetical protein